MSMVRSTVLGGRFIRISFDPSLSGLTFKMLVVIASDGYAMLSHSPIYHVLLHGAHVMNKFPIPSYVRCLTENARHASTTANGFSR